MARRIKIEMYYYVRYSRVVIVDVEDGDTHRACEHSYDEWTPTEMDADQGGGEGGWTMMGEVEDSDEPDSND